MVTAREKQFKKFLKERGLTRSFSRFKTIKRKRNIDVQVDGVKQFLTVYKKNNKTIVADRFTLRTLATTKRFNMRNIEKGFQRMKDQKRFSGKTLPKGSTIWKRGITLSEISRTPLTNVVQVDRSTPLRKKVGKLFISVTFFKGKKKQTVEGGSRQVRLLNDKSERREAFDEAFKGALSMLSDNFGSYERFHINWVHYSYFLERKRSVAI